MENIELDANDVIEVLREQRNDALDEAAILKAQVKKLQGELAELKQQPAET